MKTLLALALFLISLSANSQSTETYEDPPNACYEGCTEWMQDLLFSFENSGQVLKQEPQVFSGDCRHLSSSLNPDHNHHAVVMIDKHPSENRYYFSTIFSYFAEENPFQSWTLADARQEMHPYWLDNGNIIRGKISSRVEILREDQSLALVYWMRQDPITNTL
jgi:hypothetical protein